MLPDARHRRTTMIDVRVPVVEPTIPADVQRFLNEAEQRIVQFQQSAHIPGFVPSDAERVYCVLHSISETALAPGQRFCEWGSGFGVVTSLAAVLGFEAWGIEIEAELVDAARQLAADFDLPAEFVHGSFIQRGGEDLVERNVGFSWLVPDSGSAYAEMDLDPDDFDIVFAYPWPDEDQMTANLFQRFAAEGSLLITFHGGDDIRVRRKSAGTARRRAK
jgi:hypothetical protein